MTSKQRAYLKGLAQTTETILNIGKATLTPEVVAACDEALEKRELIKVGVLKNCVADPMEMAQTIAERTNAEVVQVIGKKIVLFRPSKKHPKIKL